MIEIIVLDFLNENLNIPACMETPQDKPEEYILIEKVGGGEENFISNATLAIQSISSKGLYNAATLNEKVKGVMYALLNKNVVSKVSLNSDYNFTNTKTKEYRYQAVFNITYKEIKNG